MKNETEKQKLIHYIDGLKETFYQKLYKSQIVELNNLRNKYVYKDISSIEFIEDVKKIKKLHDDLRWSYYY